MTEISAFVNWVGIFSFTQFINYIIVHRSTSRRNGRVVEGTGLENRRGFTPSVSSNLTSSAINIDEQIIAPLIVKSVAFFVCADTERADIETIAFKQEDTNKSKNALAFV